jgi:hypothetical protein
MGNVAEFGAKRLDGCHGASPVQTISAADARDFVK